MSTLDIWLSPEHQLPSFFSPGLLEDESRTTTKVAFTTPYHPSLLSNPATDPIHASSNTTPLPPSLPTHPSTPPESGGKVAARLFAFPPLPARTPNYHAETTPIPSAVRAQALERYLADPYPRHPHLPLRFLYASSAPHSWAADPIRRPDDMNKVDCEVEELAEVEILGQDGVVLVRLRMELSGGSAYQYSGHVHTYRRSDTGAFVAGTESVDDSKKRFVCVDRVLSTGFPFGRMLSELAERGPTSPSFHGKFSPLSWRTFVMHHCLSLGFL
ncbi:hypothetical protein BDK51DRAFT_45400 [Blyttiomyces helicus]|uniref:Uncharacterized protein n=1 Tax=Blyttiomyces helicus TaxID=388810 RepID=A0A4P9VYZ1_9FUNG|nr:hypothetical protein BDK51DRAFT_45400 [Blyttiomyces helicus]|eukprot:RKO84195.1 hypothetical protein BDK51DRAFT_45400 [Blyttiomyces helicus]